jgi:hypothetical protein
MGENLDVSSITASATQSSDANINVARTKARGAWGSVSCTFYIAVYKYGILVNDTGFAEEKAQRFRQQRAMPVGADSRSAVTPASQLTSVW